jgi:hypothetical protein
MRISNKIDLFLLEYYNKYETFHILAFILFATKTFISTFVYNNHYSLIFSFNLSKYSDFKYKNEQLDVKIVNDERYIEECYRSIGRIISNNIIKIYLRNNYDCWIGFLQKKPVCAMWVMKKNIYYPSFSGRSFANSKDFILDEKIGIFWGHITHKDFRRQGISSTLTKRMIYYYKDTLQYLLCTIGATNLASVSNWIKLGAKLDGVVHLIKLFSLVFKNNIFIDKDEIDWTITN